MHKPPNCSLFPDREEGVLLRVLFTRPELGFFQVFLLLKTNRQEKQVQTQKQTMSKGQHCSNVAHVVWLKGASHLLLPRPRSQHSRLQPGPLEKKPRRKCWRMPVPGTIPSHTASKRYPNRHGFFLAYFKGTHVHGLVLTRAALLKTGLVF